MRMNITMLMAMLTVLSIMAIPVYGAEVESTSSLQVQMVPQDPAVLLFNDMQEFIDLREEKIQRKYNRTIVKFPSFVDDMFYHEEVFVIIELDSGDYLYIKAVKSGSELTVFSMVGSQPSFTPTITVLTDEPTVRDVIGSSTDRLAMEKCIQAFVDGHISIDIEDLGESIVFWTLKQTIPILNL